MDETSLRSLATQGLTSAPAVRHLEVWCWERAEATGDSRFCGIARALGNIAETWDAHGALPSPVVSDLAASLSHHLPGVLDVQSPEEGAGLARLLREDIAEILQRWTF